MNEVEKYLRKLKQKDLEAFILLMDQLKKDYTKIPGLRKIVGKRGVFRVRMGTHRVVFSVRGKAVEILRISRRSEKTYKNL